jgi:hypothetical protein
MACPYDSVCQNCMCSEEDDVCFPGERLQAEHKHLRAALRQVRDCVAGMLAAWHAEGYIEDLEGHLDDIADFASRALDSDSGSVK